VSISTLTTLRRKKVSAIPESARNALRLPLSLEKTTSCVAVGFAALSTHSHRSTMSIWPIVVSGIQRCVCLRTESMNKFQIKGNWNEIKGKLKQKYAQLTDDDLTFAEGKEEELLGRLQKRLGKTDEEIRREIEES
jgi:uncharacterized protein YjbJ (UPF0337 family)